MCSSAGGRARATSTEPVHRAIGLALVTAIAAWVSQPVAAAALPRGPAAPATVRVEARENVFEPVRVSIDPGDTVVWDNAGFRRHTVTSDDGLFDSGSLAAGEGSSFTFPDEGLFFYHCVLHGSPRNGMWGVVEVGDPPPATGARTRIVVPDDARTISRAVSRAEPHSTIVIRPGTYHESVIVRVPDLVIRGVDRFRTVLDGRDERSTGISVEGFGDVSIRDLTIRNYRTSGISLRDVRGYTVERVDLIMDRTFGLDAVGSVDGLVEDVFAWGSGDSGIRIAGCGACSTVIRSSQARWSFLGIATVNATGVVVSDSRAVHNAVGIAVLADAAAPFAPGSGVSIVGNVVRDNDYSEVPGAGLSTTSGIPFGTGIWVAGSANAWIASNTVERNGRYGILVSRSIDRLADPVNATVTGNTIAGDGGLDLAWDGAGRDDCFAANTLARPTGPPDLQTRFPCSARPFDGAIYPPVFDDIQDALALDPDRPQRDPPEPARPHCQRGRPGCRQL